jgi:hypothetical protein
MSTFGEIQYISKKGKEKKRILDAQIKLVKSPDKGGKEESETYTVAQLIDRYVSATRSLTVLADFSTELAVILYRMNPTHPFIEKHGAEFAEFIKRAEDQLAMRDSVESVKAALLAAQGEGNGLQVQNNPV